LFSQSYIIVGGILGGVIGNEIEYQSLKRQTRPIFEYEFSKASPNEISFDTLAELLKNSRRRKVIEVVSERGEQININELVEIVTAEEVEVPRSSVTSNQIKRVYVPLYRSHLPKLDSADVIDYDEESGQIYPDVNLQRASNFLKDIESSLENTGLDEDLILELLKNSRRRQVIKMLSQRDETIVLGELAELIASEENNVPISNLTSDQRKRIYVALYQTHLPKLDEAGLVDYDQDRGTVERGNRFNEDRFGVKDSKSSIYDIDIDRLENETVYYAIISGLAFVIGIANVLEWWPISFIDTSVLFVAYTILILTPILYKVTK